jgi:hypothetical protein
MAEKPPPAPAPGSEWDWEKDDKGNMKKLYLCKSGAKTCTEPKPHNEEIWCISSKECDQEDKPCQCWLFWAKKGDKEWKPRPEPKKKYPYDDDYFYACFCVRVVTPVP